MKSEGLTPAQLAERNAEYVTEISRLEKACAALAAENAGIKSAIPEPRDIEDDNDNMDDVSLAEDFGFNHAVERMRRQIPETPTTDAFLAEVRAQGLEMMREHPSIKLFSLTHICDELAARIRKGGKQ
ncbi:hypothetical protein B9E08_005059 [Escherichia coli]|nr:hypothetical protein [Escherichia coli]